MIDDCYLIHQTIPAFLKCLRNKPLAINAPITPPMTGEMQNTISIGVEINPDKDRTYSADIPFC